WAVRRSWVGSAPELVGPAVLGVPPWVVGWVRGSVGVAGGATGAVVGPGSGTVAAVTGGSKGVGDVTPGSGDC
ncbi:MAG: hypothetical protein WAR61_00410, partial [Candidatus Microthrix parvicella]